MSRMAARGLWVAALHMALVATVAGRFEVDRATRPRVWTRAAPVDPSLPVRGRYLSLRLEAAAGEGLRLTGSISTGVALTIRDGQLTAIPAPTSVVLWAHQTMRNGNRVVVLDAPVAFFISDRAADPSRVAAGEELWVEVTLPRAGPPRPIRLGIKKDGVLTPLEIK